MKHTHALILDKRNGHYCARIQVNGIRKYFKFSTNRREADQQLRQLEQNIAAGRVPFSIEETTLIVMPDGKKDLRIEELMHRHLKWIEANRTPGTFKNRRLHIRTFLTFLKEQNSLWVSQITRETLETFHVWVKSFHGRGVNAGNEALGHVKAMCNWAIDLDICTMNIIKFPKIRRELPETRRFRPEDIEALFKQLPVDFQDIIKFGLLTGLRPLELRMLTWDQIQDDNDGGQHVYIEHHKTSQTARSPKPRTVPLCRDAQEIINRQFHLHPRSRYVFLNTQAEPYTRSAMYHRLHRYCTKIGIKGTVYGLRHTFGTMQGVCMRILMEREHSFSSKMNTCSHGT